MLSTARIPNATTITLGFDMNATTVPNSPTAIANNAGIKKIPIAISISVPISFFILYLLLFNYLLYRRLFPRILTRDFSQTSLQACGYPG